MFEDTIWPFSEPEADEFKLVPESPFSRHRLTSKQIDLIENLARLQTQEYRLSAHFILLLRTSHPALKNREQVKFNAYRKCWSVSRQSDQPVLPLHIGHFAVHIVPHDSEYWLNYNPCCIKPNWADVGFDELPSDQDLAVFRSFFVGSIGVRVLLGGYFDILYPSESSLLRAHKGLKFDHASMEIERWNKKKSWVSDFRFRYMLTVHDPPTLNTPPMMQASLSSSQSKIVPEKAPSGSISARIHLHGDEYLTTATHDFVHYKQRSDGKQLTRWQRLKTSVLYPRIATMGQRQSGSRLVGTPVYTTRSPAVDTNDQMIGHIAVSFDKVCTVMSWPTDFPCDLTLIAEKALKSEFCKLCVPSIQQIDEKFMRPEELWRQEDKSCCIVYHDAHQEEGDAHLTQHRSPVYQKCLLEGLQVLWPDKVATYQRSFLWRTETKSTHWDSNTGDNILEPESLRGVSGSLLCVGNPE